jgi:ribosome-binding factor A
MRAERVASQLEKELSVIVSREMNDPRLGFVTITKVSVTPDLKNAVIFFTTMGDKKNDLKTLEHAKGYVRTLLAQRIRLRFIPEIEFKLDESYEYEQKMEKLFEQLDKDHKKE